MNGLVKKITGIATGATTLFGGVAAAQKPIEQVVLDSLNSQNTVSETAPDETPNEKTEALKKWDVTPGYNAIQVGIVDGGILRGRLYTNIEGRVGKFTLGIAAMNEGGSDYFFGESKGYAGVDGIPISIVHVERYGLIPGEGVTRLEGATGLRFNLEGMLPGIHYGSVEVIKHDAVGEEGTNDYEAILFLGREIRTGGVEATLQLMEGGRVHAEVEGIGPALSEGAHYIFRPMARVEYNHGVPDVHDGPVLIGALQVQLK